MTGTTDILAEQRLASAHHPSTWTEEAEFDRQLWTWHDAHHQPTRYGVCPTCNAEWEEFFADEMAKKVAMYDLAKELGV